MNQAQETDPNEPKFSVPEACPKVKLGKTALRLALSKGEIGHFRIGKKIWIPQSAINQYLATKFHPVVRDNSPAGTSQIQRAAGRKSGCSEPS
jgi:excisionase family DNA binding protein